MAVGQASAIDRDQQAVSVSVAQRRDVRIAGLWRWLLQQRMGREFLWEVMLADVGYDRPHAIHDPQGTVLVEQAALHNLALRWMNGRVRRHPDLYRQMLAEASKREDDEREAEAAMRAQGSAEDQEP